MKRCVDCGNPFKPKGRKIVCNECLEKRDTDRAANFCTLEGGDTGRYIDQLRDEGGYDLGE